MMRRNARPLIALVMVGAAMSCSGGEDSSDQAAPPSPQSTVASADGVLGTIHADLDGEARTWYVIEGDVRGEPYSSGMFIPVDGGIMVSLGGFDTAEPPMDSFQVEVAEGNMSLGEYEDRPSAL